MRLFRTLIACLAFFTAIDGARAATPPQQPFICRTVESGLGQPLIDNQEGIGHPVLDANGQTVGYSKNCNIPSRVEYFYYTGKEFKPFDPGTDFQQHPADLKTVTVNGATVPFVVRVEGGTINRFLYTIAMLAPVPEATGKWNTDAWNKKLIYWLRGGVGIGHQQGTALWFKGALSRSERQIMPRLLEQGYAVVSSSGNETGVHYNMRLAGETAVMTKAHFASVYGKPLYTIGIGGSGGAVQQYLFAQNLPGLLDAGIPIQSYPDMITQTIPISDCPLLGQYFRDAVARDPASPWSKWSQQAWIEGMNASDTAPNALFGGKGSTECINGWRQAMPTVVNPVYKDPKFDLAAKAYGYRKNALANVKWTHWNDLAEIYGTDEKGFAPIPLDNVGVQYGLAALANGQIDANEFLRINACVGGWKEQADFVQWKGKADPYDAQNMKRSASCADPHGTPAARREGSVAAIAAAYRTGQVFLGRRLGIPMIDLRPYLEPDLNMHNARQSFAVRARLLDGNAAEAKNQVIWFAPKDDKTLTYLLEALAVLDRMLATGTVQPEFADRCVDGNGELIASGPHAWDGILDRNPPGACTRAFPIYSSPRMVAGESIKGDVFKCALKPVDTALADGTYPERAAFTPAQRDWLRRIFPTGVCDYRQSDAAKPQQQ
jgi:hypothetical protein